MLAVVMASVGNYRGRGVEYATRLRSDLLKHLAVPHRVYCFTDQPASFFPRTRCKPHPTGEFQNGRLFREGQFQEDRILYLSTDTLILKDIDELASYEGEFAMSQDLHVIAWRNGAYHGGQIERLEEVFPGLVVPYTEYPPQSARIVTFNTAMHEVGGWVAEYWEPAYG